MTPRLEDATAPVGAEKPLVLGRGDNDSETLLLTGIIRSGLPKSIFELPEVLNDGSGSREVVARDFENFFIRRLGPIALSKSEGQWASWYENVSETGPVYSEGTAGDLPFVRYTDVREMFGLAIDAQDKTLATDDFVRLLKMSPEMVLKALPEVVTTLRMIIDANLDTLNREQYPGELVTPMQITNMVMFSLERFLDRELSPQEKIICLNRPIGPNTPVLLAKELDFLMEQAQAGSESVKAEVVYTVPELDFVENGQRYPNSDRRVVIRFDKNRDMIFVDYNPVFRKSGGIASQFNTGAFTRELFEGDKKTDPSHVRAFIRTNVESDLIDAAQEQQRQELTVSVSGRASGTLG